MTQPVRPTLAASAAVFRERMKTSGAIVVSHSMQMIRNLCTMGAVLEGGHLTMYDRINDAIEAYESLLGADARRQAEEDE